MKSTMSNQMSSIRYTDSKASYDTSRPDSSQVMRSIFFVLNLIAIFLAWKDRQNLAYNDAMEEAYSAGFIRVPFDLPLNDLRHEIEHQCGSDDAFPKEYVYLRSVGRALTRVKDKQELELRVKHFRPPQTIAPELFLLEFRQDDYMNAPNTPATVRQAAQQIHTSLTKSHSSQHTERMKTNDPNYSNDPRNDGFLAKTKDFDKLQDEQERLRRRQIELERLRREVEERQKQLNNEDQRKKMNVEHTSHDRAFKINEMKRNRAAIIIQSRYRGYNVRKWFAKYKKTQEQEYIRRLRERTMQPKNIRKAHTVSTSTSRTTRRSKAFSADLRDILGSEMDKKTISQLSSDEEATLSEGTLIDEYHMRDEQLRTTSHQIDSSDCPGDDDDFMFRTDYDNRVNLNNESFQTTAASSIISFVDNMSSKPKQPSSSHPKSSTPTTKGPSSPLFQRIKTRDSKLTLQPEEQAAARLMIQKQQTPPVIQRRSITSQELHNPSLDNKKSPKLVQNHFGLPKNDPKSKTNGTTPRLQETPRRRATNKNGPERHLFQNRADNQDKTGNNPNTKLSLNAQESHKTEPERKATVTRSETNVNTSRKNTVSNSGGKQSNSSMANGEQTAKNLIKPRMERTSSGQKADNVKTAKSESDLEQLYEKYEVAKTDRLELEILREELIKRLKQIHNKITLKRKEARDLWKKQYFSEKKKTPPIEEKVQSMFGEIENLQKKICLNYETDIKVAIQSGRTQECERNTVKLTSFRLQQDIDSIKRQLEQAKLRLITDIRLRNQAEIEIKALRIESNETKLNLSHIKRQIKMDDTNEIMV